MAVDTARAKSLFLAASDLPDQEARAVYLNRECVGDVELRGRVEALLRANDAASLLPAGSEDTATSAFGPDSPANAHSHLKGAEIGSVLAGKYQLIEEIGEGGMGSVYRAEQTEPVKRSVAVKVIKAGMDSKAVLARFGAERQALALMDHPNIAKVLDAGTTNSGQPFFVMELVKGIPITEYCDERKLTPRQRLELFLPVCQAIQHAHQKGIIHRDIKPSNVLVAMYDDRPVPKVIDFGVAKAAGQSQTDQAQMTGFGMLVGTPEYMSPEQASLNNLDIDTRSDVYSLGVLLYELLTGSTPVDRRSLGKAALLEVLRIVREVEAPRPSTKLSSIDTLPSVAANRGTDPTKLPKLMQGELDWVVLKALEKDRNRRYESANGLARDIQRHLADELVEARPPTMWYRYRKFTHRHRGAILSSYLLVIGIVIFTGMLYTQKERARSAEELARASQRAEVERAEGEKQAKQQAVEEARKARKQTEIAEAVIDFLERDLIAQANPLGDQKDDKPDPELKLKTALDRAVARIAKRFEGKPLVEASIRRAIGKAYAGRGLFSEALSQQETACDLYRIALANADPADVETLVRHPYIDSLFELINLYGFQSQTTKALATIGILEDQIRRSDVSRTESKEVLETIQGLREVYQGGDVTKALKKNQDIMRKLFGAPSTEQTAQGQTGVTNTQAEKDQATGERLQNLMKDMEKFTAAMKLVGLGKYAEAEQILTPLIETRRAKGGPEVQLWIPMLADVYRRQGKYAEARVNFEAGRDGIKKVFGEDHPSLGACYYGLAQTLLSEKIYEQAEAESRAALAFYERRMPDDPIRYEMKGMIGVSLMGQKKYVAAEPLLLASYDGFKQLEKTNPAIGTARLAEAVDQLIELFTAKNQPDELKKWQAERAKYPSVKPKPGEKK